MANILHLSYDLRDPKGREITSAVRNLIQAGRRFAGATVIDLARVPRFAQEGTCMAAGGHLQVNTMGLPYGLFLLKHLDRACHAIRQADRRGLLCLADADLIHAHKLTFEGYIGSLLAERLDIPLAVSLRQTDFEVLKYRPELRKIYKRILEQSCIVFYLLPIMKTYLKKYFGDDFFERHIDGKTFFLPNMVSRMTGPPSCPEPGHLLTIARMTRKSVKRKNLKNLFKAIRALDVTLTVIGGGDYLNKVNALAKTLKVRDKVVFKGSVPNARLYDYFARAQGFVLPSFSESFGMSYAEALVCGTPILYSSGVLGFDGVFENVGVGVNPHSVQSITRGLVRLIARNEFFRNTIKDLDRRQTFDIFSSQSIGSRYMHPIERVLSDHPGDPAFNRLQAVQL